MNRIITLAALVALAVSVTARADPARAPSQGVVARAEQLFEQGRAHADAHRWAEACRAFEASLRLDPALGTRLNLAACQEKLGKLGRAWTLYRESFEIAKREGDTQRRDYARKRAAALERRLARLAISTVAQTCRGVAVTLDDEPVALEAPAAVRYVDPGAHRVAASARGCADYVQQLAAVAGAAKTVEIPMLEPLPPALPARDAASPATASDTGVVQSTSAPDLRTRRTAMRTAAIGGGALVGLGVAFGVAASNSYDQANELCGDRLVCSPANAERGRQLVHTTRSRATVATALFTAGSAAFVASFFLYLSLPSPSRVAPSQARLQIVPVAHDGGAGLAVGGVL